LPARELAICARLKEARERLLGETQAAFASRVGISRERLLSYELARVPLRCELALRICRCAIISEEWLATGRTKSAQRAAAERGIEERDAPSLRPFFLRQCVDLTAEPEYHEIAPGTLFSDAFDRTLASVYERLVREFFFLPRIDLRDSDPLQLIQEYLKVVMQRWTRLTENEAIRLNRNPALARRSFFRSFVEVGAVLFKRYMGYSTPEIAETRFDFLRAIANDTSAAIGPLHSTAPAKKKAMIELTSKTG
jgi:DNA-binding XRE family transcriptional regulator